MKFATIKDTQGRLIAALSIPELDKLQARCEKHRAECAKRGIDIRSDIALMCSAVSYFRESSDRGPIAAAFARFSEVRRECIQHGYAVPPIIGTPHSAQIDSITALMEQALAAARPLPGEPAYLTRRISDDYRQAIKNAIDTLNEITTVGRGLQRLDLPELWKTTDSAAGNAE